MKTAKIENVESYIVGFPKETQMLLKELRETIIKAAPKAEEIISYQMPAYKYFGIVVYFAGYKNHIGLYPGASAIEAFKKELALYKLSKGTVQLPLDKPLPLKLITKIVAFKVKVNMEKAELKKKK